LAQENTNINLPQNIDLLSPAVGISSLDVKVAVRKMIIDSYAKNSLVGRYNYWTLGLNYIFGTKIKAREVEDELHQQISIDDIVLFTQERDSSQKREIRGRVRVIFEDVLKPYGINYDENVALLEQYLQMIMIQLRQKLEAKSMVDKQGEFRSKAKTRLRRLYVEDIFIYLQYMDSLKKQAMRKKVRAIFEIFARNNNVYFENYEMGNFLDEIMNELKQEIFDKIKNTVMDNKNELRDILMSSLTSQEVRVYFSTDPWLNLPKQELTNKANDIFKKWLEGYDAYFDVTHCESFYHVHLDKVMIEVAQKKKAIMHQGLFKIIRAKQLSPTTRVIKEILLEQLIRQAI